MTLSRWRRVATGIAAGVIVLSAALLGASFRDDGAGVSVASDLRPDNVIPIEEDPVETTDTNADGSVQVIEVDELPDEEDGDPSETTADPADDEVADEVADTSETPADDTTGDSSETADADATGDTDDSDDTGDTADSSDTGNTDDTADSGDTGDTADSGDTGDTGDTADSAADPEPAATAEPAAPVTSVDDSLGTGGGVNDAECALDRLVIYAGARRGGVAGSIRNALAQAGFGAGCAAPITVLASNCPQQFAGVLGAGSGYDPTNSYVASSANVDRETLAAVLGTIGYAGNEIDILDFGFVNADQPGEQWIAIFVPPSFSGWENLASRAGLSPTSSSLCSPSGELAG